MPGTNPGPSAQPQSNERARPLGRKMRMNCHPGRMEEQEPEEEHDPQPKRAPPRHHSSRDAETSSNESRACEIRPEQAARDPARHQAGNEAENEKMSDAENDR